MVAAVILLIRLAGGLLIVRSLRARARRLEGHTAHHAETLTQQLGLSAQVEWLRSSDIDAPAAIGWRRPAVLLPAGLDDSEPLGLLRPLIAHELEHVRRHDAAKAAAQGVLDALLFHCPGASWLSRQVRIAREESCDDAAVRICGEPAAYAEALARLAGVRRNVPVLGAAGPGDAACLSRRIRRVLKGETNMGKLTWLQAGLLSLAVLATLGSGLSLASAALADSAAQQKKADGDPTAPAPYAYASHQPGAPISITRSTSKDGFVFGAVRVRNVSEAHITGVTFVAVVPDRLRVNPVRIIPSKRVQVSLEPGQATELEIELLPIGDLHTDAKGHAPALGVVEVAFADESQWLVRPDTAARSWEDALYLEKNAVAKDLVGKPASGRQTGSCLDHRGLQYSTGAIVPVLGSPSELAQCEGGAWVGYSLPASPVPAR
jgi:hypothetical protein